MPRTDKPRKPRKPTKPKPEVPGDKLQAMLNAMKEQTDNVSYVVHAKAQDAWTLPALTVGGKDIVIAAEPAAVVPLTAYDDEEAIHRVATKYGLLGVDKLVAIERGVEREIVLPINADDDGWDNDDGLENDDEQAEEDHEAS